MRKKNLLEDYLLFAKTNFNSPMDFMEKIIWNMYVEEDLKIIYVNSLLLMEIKKEIDLWSIYIVKNYYKK